MNEPINFGEQAYGYIILLLVLVCGLFLFWLFWFWFRKYFKPSNRILNKRNRIVLLLLISWPLLLAGGGFWGAYQIGYRHFYSLRIEPKKGLVIQYLWPKSNVKILAEDVTSVAMVRTGLKGEGSNVLVIKTKSGSEFLSTAPVPEPNDLPRKIYEAIKFVGLH